MGTNPTQTAAVAGENNKPMSSARKRARPEPAAAAPVHVLLSKPSVRKDFFGRAIPEPERNTPEHVELEERQAKRAKSGVLFRFKVRFPRFPVSPTQTPTKTGGL